MRQILYISIVMLVYLTACRSTLPTTTRLQPTGQVRPIPKTEPPTTVISQDQVDIVSQSPIPTPMVASTEQVNIPSESPTQIPVVSTDIATTPQLTVMSQVGKTGLVSNTTSTPSPQASPFPTLAIATPTEVVSFVEILSDKPLTFDVPTVEGEGLQPLSEDDNLPEATAAFVLLGWTENNEVVVRPGAERLPVQGVTSTPTPEPNAQWAIAPTTGQVRIAAEWTETDELSQEQEQLLQALNSIPVEFPRIPSPDGQRVAVSQFGQNLSIYNVETEGNEELSLPLTSSDIFKIFAWTPPVWSPDGSKIAYIAASEQEAFSISGIETTYPEAHPYLYLYQLQVYDFNQQQLLKFDVPQVSYSPTALNWSPDSRYLAFVSPPDLQARDHLFVVALENKLQQDLTPNLEQIRPENFFPNVIKWSPDGKTLAYGDTNIGLVYTMDLNIK